MERKSPPIYFPISLSLCPLESHAPHPEERTGFHKMVRPQEGISQRLHPTFVLETALTVFRRELLPLPSVPDTPLLTPRAAQELGVG